MGPSDDRLIRGMTKKSSKVIRGAKGAGMRFAQGPNRHPALSGQDHKGFPLQQKSRPPAGR